MSERVLRCPFCGDKRTHHHLYVNLERGVYYCHLCGASGVVSKLKEYYPNIDFTYLGNPVSVERPVRWQYKFRRLDLYSSSQLDASVASYLRGRGLTDRDIVSLRVHVSPDIGEYAVFPVGGDPYNYWCARATSDSASVKWRFPANGAVKMTRDEVVWNIENQSRGSEIWVCEGVFDALFVGGVALFGKRVFPKQLFRILELRPSKVLIGFDNDAYVSAVEAMNKFKHFVPCEVCLPPSPFKDYGEMLMERRRNERP